MKKIFTILALCAMTLAANAAYRVYLSGITSMTVDTLASNTKNQFTLTFDQKCKNTAEYGKPDTYYTSTVKLVLNSDDRTLEGTYTTEGADPNKSSANVNDQTINLVTSEFTSGSTSRLLRKDSISTFTIERIDATHYAITSGNLVFSQRVNQVDTWAYRYSYNADEILVQGIAPTPYIFGYEGTFIERFYEYDLSVKSMSMVYSQSDYSEHRYQLTMQCTGVCRETNAEHNYEVQIMLYTEGAEPSSIVGSYATQNGSKLMWASNCYVKDLNEAKQRNLANDSISGIKIESKGNNQYRFTGGPLICTDIDMNYYQVHSQKRIEATHYYYFSDNNGQGIDFSFDGENTELIPNSTAGLNDLQEGNARSTKILRDGQLFIEKNGILYNAQGAVVK